MQFFNPGNFHNSIRIMPGNPTSPYPNSRVPYIRMQKDGDALGIDGDIVDRESAEAHVSAATMRKIPAGVF